MKASSWLMGAWAAWVLIGVAASVPLIGPLLVMLLAFASLGAVAYHDDDH